MSNFLSRVAGNILPLSVKKTLPEAFAEWSFTEQVHDHEQATETCELCEQEDLQYHFLIKNQFTDGRLWVGSSCILKFGVSVFENGHSLSAGDAKKKLDRLTEKMHQDFCVKALQRLAEAENNVILKNALAYYQRNGDLTPKYAFVVLWRLRANKINHSPSFFKVSLKKSRHKDDLAQMPLSNVQAIWPALTTSQRAMAERLGHSPPSVNSP